MFSLFISFDLLMSFINYQFLIVLLFLFHIWGYNNFYLKQNSYFLNLLQFLKKEIMMNSKMKLSFNLNFYISMFSIILLLNFLGLSPFSFTLSSQLYICFFLSLCFWSMVMMNNLFINFFDFLSHLVPSGSPMALSQFMVLIESISQLIRPLTLGVRLMANMTAGHLIMILSSMPLFLFNFVTLPLTLLILLEIMVAFIQSYVFLILLSMYLGEFNS